MTILIIGFLVCCIIALIIHSSKSEETETMQIQVSSTSIKQPKKHRQKNQKVRSYDDWQKRMRKKQYLSEYSEFVTISIEDVQRYALNNPGQKELIDQILEAIMDGKNYMQIDRKTYDELIKEKYSNS